MFSLSRLWQRATGKISEAYCVRCRAHRQVVKVRYVRLENTKRLEGRCQTCEAKTSSFVAV
jgi:hypothetical protein